MSDWLLSYQLNLDSLQRRALASAWRGQTRNKGFPNNTKSQSGALKDLASLQCVRPLFLKFQAGQAWKSCKESSPCVLKPGSAFAKVHFCISEHTNPSACSNSLQPSLRQLMTTAQQQHCLISNVFLNLGCQGSLVGGCLLYFSYKKKCFFSPQTMTNPKTKKEGALPAIVVKAAVSLL